MRRSTNCLLDFIGLDHLFRVRLERLGVEPGVEFRCGRALASAVLGVGVPAQAPITAPKSLKRSVKDDELSGLK